MPTLSPRQRAENQLFPSAEHLVDPKLRLLYAAVPKCGCSAGKTWFLRAADPALFRTPGAAPRVHALAREQWSLAAQPEAERESLARSCFAFTFIRDPLQRLASAYTEKFTVPAPHALFDPAREILELACELGVQTGPPRGLTFREFARVVCSLPDEALDSHWRPQHLFLTLHPAYFVAPVDRLNETLTLLAGHLRRPDAVPLSINLTPYTRPAESSNMADTPSTELHTRGLRPRAADLYDHVIAEQVRARFATDLSLHKAAVDAWNPDQLVRHLISTVPSPEAD